jgi:hypothetical protein
LCNVDARLKHAVALGDHVRQKRYRHRSRSQIQRTGSGASQVIDGRD